MTKWISSAVVIVVVFYFTIMPLKAKQVVVPKDGIPANVAISYLDSIVTVSWDGITDVEIYYIYSQDDPYSEFTLIDSTTTTSWNGSFTQDKQFFYVTAEVERFVLIPGGTFEMGDSFSEGESDELPVHSINLSDFYIGKYEVTQAEWACYMPEEDWIYYGTGDNYPAYYLSWYATIKYCNLRSIAEDLIPCYTISGSTDPDLWGTVPTSSNSTWDAVICNWSANGYRLPTEAEWEYAARGGLCGQRFPNGATISHSSNGDSQANYYSLWENGSPYFSYDVSPTECNHPDYAHSSQTGSFMPNGYGLYDMAGNMEEWCWDKYGTGTAYQDYFDYGTFTNPHGTILYSYRILRGGDWCFLANNCRVANREYNNPFYRELYVGFRLSRTP